MKPDKPWTDPWIEARARREQHAIERIPDGALTQRRAILLGARYFALGTALIPLLCCLLLIVGASTRTPSPDSTLGALGTILYIMVPPAAALGALCGNRLFRHANSPEPPKEVGCMTWLILLLAMQTFVAPFFITYLHRNITLSLGRPSNLIPALYIAIALCIAAACALDPRIAQDAHLVFIGSAIVAWFICDALLVNKIVSMRSDGMLAPPDTNRFQYSLATLLFCVWGFGAWVTGLVMLARGLVR
jgi:hypothetical protein